MSFPRILIPRKGSYGVRATLLLAVGFGSALPPFGSPPFLRSSAHRAATECHSRPECKPSSAAGEACGRPLLNVAFTVWLNESWLVVFMVTHPPTTKSTAATTKTVNAYRFLIPPSSRNKLPARGRKLLSIIARRSGIVPRVPAVRPLTRPWPLEGPPMELQPRPKHPDGRTPTQDLLKTILDYQTPGDLSKYWCGRNGSLALMAPPYCPTTVPGRISTTRFAEALHPTPYDNKTFKVGDEGFGPPTFWA
jgi:hypothetical protein